MSVGEYGLLLCFLVMNHIPFTDSADEKAGVHLGWIHNTYVEVWFVSQLTDVTNNSHSVCWQLTHCPLGNLNEILYM